MAAFSVSLLLDFLSLESGRCRLVSVSDSGWETEWDLDSGSESDSVLESESG